MSRPIPEDLETFRGTPMNDVIRMGPTASPFVPDIALGPRIQRYLRTNLLNPWAMVQDIDQEPDPDFDFRKYALDRDVPANWLVYSRNQQHADRRIEEVRERAKIQEELLGHQNEFMLSSLAASMLSPENLVLLAVNPVFAGRSALSRVMGMATVGAATNMAAELPWQLRESERGWNEMMLAGALGAGFGGAIATPFALKDSFQGWQRERTASRRRVALRELRHEMGSLDSTLERAHVATDRGIGWRRPVAHEEPRSGRPARRVRDAYRALHELEGSYVQAPLARRAQISDEIARARKRVRKLERRYEAELASLPQVPRAIVRVPATGEIAIRGVIGLDHPDLEHLGANAGVIYPDSAYGPVGDAAQLGEWRFQDDEVLVLHHSPDGDPAVAELAARKTNQERAFQANEEAQIAHGVAPGSRQEAFVASLRRQGIKAVVTMDVQGHRQVRLLEPREPVSPLKRLVPAEMSQDAFVGTDGQTRVPPGVARRDSHIARMDRDAFLSIRPRDSKVQAMTPPRKGPPRHRGPGQRPMSQADQVESVAWRQMEETGRAFEAPELALQRLVPHSRVLAGVREGMYPRTLWAALQRAVGRYHEGRLWLDAEMERLNTMTESLMARVDDLPETSEQLSQRVHSMLRGTRPETMRALETMADGWIARLQAQGKWEKQGSWRRRQGLVNYLIHHFDLDKPERFEREWDLGYLANFMRESRESNGNMQDPSDTIMERRFLQIERAGSLAVSGLMEMLDLWAEAKKQLVINTPNTPFHQDVLRAYEDVWGSQAPREMGMPAPMPTIQNLSSMLRVVEDLLSSSVGGEDTERMVAAWNRLNAALHTAAGRQDAPEHLVLGDATEPGQVSLGDLEIRLLDPFDPVETGRFSRPYTAPKRDRDTQIESLRSRMDHLETVRSGYLLSGPRPDPIGQIDAWQAMGRIQDRLWQIRQNEVWTGSTAALRDEAQKLRTELAKAEAKIFPPEPPSQAVLIRNAEEMVKAQAELILRGARTYVAYTSVFDTSLARRLSEVRRTQSTLARMRTEMEGFEHGLDPEIDSVWRLLADTERQYLEWMGEGHRSPPTQVVRSQREEVRSAALTNPELLRLLQESPRDFFRYVDEAEFQGIIDDLSPEAREQVRQVVHQAWAAAQEEDRTFEQAAQESVAETRRMGEEEAEEPVGGFQAEGDLGRSLVDHQAVLDQAKTWQELVPQHVRRLADETERIRQQIDTFQANGRPVPDQVRFAYTSRVSALRQRLGDYEGIRSLIPSRDQETAEVYRRQVQEEADATIQEWAVRIDQAEDKPAAFREALEAIVPLDDQTLYELMTRERQRKWNRMTEDEWRKAVGEIESGLLAATRSLFEEGGAGRDVAVRGAALGLDETAESVTTVSRLIAGVGARQAALRLARAERMAADTRASMREGKVTLEQAANSRLVSPRPTLPDGSPIPPAVDRRRPWYAYVRKPFGQLARKKLWAQHRLRMQEFWRQRLVTHGLRMMLGGIEDPKARFLQRLPDRMLFKLYSQMVQSSSQLPSSLAPLVDRARMTVGYQLGRAPGSDQLARGIAQVKQTIAQERKFLPKTLWPPVAQRKWAQDLYAGISAAPSQPLPAGVSEPFLLGMVDFLPDRTLRSVQRMQEIQDLMQDLLRNPTADIGPQMRELLMEYGMLWAREMEGRPPLPGARTPRRQRAPAHRVRAMSQQGQIGLARQRAADIWDQIALATDEERGVLVRRIQGWGLADASMSLGDFQRAIGSLRDSLVNDDLRPEEQVIAAAYIRRAHELLQQDVPEPARVEETGADLEDPNTLALETLRHSAEGYEASFIANNHQSAFRMDETTASMLIEARPKSIPKQLWMQMLLVHPIHWPRIRGVGEARLRAGRVVWDRFIPVEQAEPRIGADAMPPEARPPELGDWKMVADIRLPNLSPEEQRALRKVQAVFEEEEGRPLTLEETIRRAQEESAHEGRPSAATYEDLFPDESLTPEELPGVPHTEADEYAALVDADDDPSEFGEWETEDGATHEDDFAETDSGDEPGTVPGGEGERAEGAAAGGRPTEEPARAAAGGEGGGGEPPEPPGDGSFQDDRFGPIGHETGERLARVVGLDPSGLGRMNRIFPVWRMANSGFLAVRRMAQLLVDVPFILEKHLRGEASPESAQNYVLRTQVHLVSALRRLHDDYRAFTEGDLATRTGDIRRRWHVFRARHGLIPQLRMTWDEYVERVGRARRNPDLESEPAIKRTAAAMTEFYRFWESELVGPDKLMEQSHIPSHRYLTVIWDQEKIAANIDGFRQALGIAAEPMLRDLPVGERGAWIERELNRILSGGQNRAGHDAVNFRRRKPTLYRKIDDQHEALQPFLVNNMEAQLLYYHRTVAPDVGIFRSTGGDMDLRSFFSSLAREVDEANQRVSQRIGERLSRMREIDGTRTEALWQLVNQANRTTSDQAIRRAFTQTPPTGARPPGLARNAVWAREVWAFVNASTNPEWKRLAKEAMKLREERRRIRRDYEWGVVDVVNTWAILRNMNTMPATMEGFLMRLGTAVGNTHGDAPARVLFWLMEKWRELGERVHGRVPATMSVPEATVATLEAAHAPDFLVERMRGMIPDESERARSRSIAQKILVQDLPFMLRTVAYQTQGGFFAVSAMVDLAKNAFYFGIRNSIEPVYRRLAGDARAWNIDKGWAEEAGALVDVLLNHFVVTRWDIADDAHQLTWVVDRGRRLNQSLAMASGLIPITKATRALSSILFMHHLAKVLPAIANGTADAADLTRMTHWGIGQAEARAILPHLVHTQGGWVISPEGMDPGLKDRIYQAIIREAHQTTVAPGPADLPWTTHGEWPKLLLMYKSFTMSNHLRTFTQGLQIRDQRVAAWVLAALGLGALGYVLRRKADGKHIDGGEMVIQSVERSGILSIFWDMNEWINALTNGAMAPHSMVGAPYPYWREWYDEFPISSAIRNGVNAGMGAAKFLTLNPEDVKQKEVNAIRRMIFFSTLPGVSLAFNAGADQVGAWTRSLREREMPDVQISGTWSKPRIRATGRNLPPQVMAAARPGFERLKTQAQQEHRLPDQLEARAILMDAWQQWATKRTAFDETRRRVNP